jgi:peptidoglycan/xylan/chitin deacetylase (PgdA/CDA1 family)
MSAARGSRLRRRVRTTLGAALLAMACATTLVQGQSSAAAPPARPVPQTAGTVAQQSVVIAPRPDRPHCRAGLVALTFDDGPARRTTDRLVDILQRNQVPATFFEIGSHVQALPAISRRVHRAGFQIGNHTWDHPPLTTLRGRAIRHEITTTTQALRAAGTESVHLVRPPYGDVNGRVRRIIASMGLKPVLWTIDSNDWRGGSTKQVTRSVLGQLRKHHENIVLQHDGVTNSPASVRAVPRIIRKAKARGYCFATLDSSGTPTPPKPVLTARVTPGNEAGPTPVTITLHLSEPTSRPVTVHLVTTAGTAAPAFDYTPVDVTVRFPSGSRGTTVQVPVVDDATVEGTETFEVELGEADGLSVETRRVAAEILDNDAALSPS